MRVPRAAGGQGARSACAAWCWRAPDTDVHARQPQHDAHQRCLCSLALSVPRRQGRWWDSCTLRGDAASRPAISLWWNTVTISATHRLHFEAHAAVCCGVE